MFVVCKLLLMTTQNKTVKYDLSQTFTKELYNWIN